MKIREFKDKNRKAFQCIHAGTARGRELLIVRGRKAMSVSREDFDKMEVRDLGEMEIFHVRFFKSMAELYPKALRNLTMYGEMWEKLNGQDVRLTEEEALQLLNKRLDEMGYIVESYDTTFSKMAMRDIRLRKTIQPDAELALIMKKLSLIGTQHAGDILRDQVKRRINGTGLIINSDVVDGHKSDIDSDGAVSHYTHVMWPMLMSVQSVENLIEGLKVGCNAEKR